jgi:hypothetical protein
MTGGEAFNVMFGTGKPERKQQERKRKKGLI